MVRKKMPGKITASLQARRAHLAGQQTMLTVSPTGALEILDGDWATQLHPGCPTRLCRCCARILCQCCFRANKLRHGSIAQNFHPDCVICEYELREEWRRDHIFEEAARSRLADHMRRERDQGLHTCKTLKEYQILTGVTVIWLEELMRRAWENNEQCAHCESVGRKAHWHAICPVIEGIPDLTRMTIDRTDRTRRIDRDNLTLMCLSGNISKNDTDPHVNAIRSAYWRLHNASIVKAS